ncbi:MAG: glutathione S-transferase [Gammaproteobacteria bacterium]|nr:glutathione S-transferase [Gammaproteobacteria bacterium]
MKLYDFAMAPNARRVRMFAAEKGIELETVSIDLSKREQMNDGYRAINPRLAVPALVLDDGTLITESVAICRYLDALAPEPALFGTDAKDQAIVEMWHRRVELEGMQAVADGVRNSVEFFAGRGLPGAVDFPQIPALAERGKQRVDLFFAMLNERLADSEYIAGDNFTIADIAALIGCDFAKVIKKRISEEQSHLHRWYAAVRARPSASA